MEPLKPTLGEEYLPVNNLDPLGSETRPTLFIHFISVLIIILLSVSAHAAELQTPSLFGDDWGVLSEIVNVDNLCHLSGSFLRPFSGCGYSIFREFAGTNVSAYQAISLAINTASAVMLYVVLNEIFSSWRVFNLFVASLFSIYPATIYHHTIQRAFLQPVALFFFLFSCLLLWKSFANRKSSHSYLFSSILILIFSLLVYESHIGIAIGFSLILFCYARVSFGKWQLRFFVPVLITLVIAIGRYLSQLQVGVAFGYDSSNMTSKLSDMVSRLLIGYRVMLQWSWTGGIRKALPSHGWIVEALLWVGVFLLAIALMGVVLHLWQDDKTNFKDRSQSFPISTRSNYWLVILGFLLIGAGYLPSITVSVPGLGWIDSRLNEIPSIGASILIVALLMLLIRKIVPLNWIATVLYILLVPMLFIATITHQSVWRDTLRAWGIQQDIWSQLRTELPHITSDRIIVMFLPECGINEGWITGPPPIAQGPYGFSGALSILYDDPDLRGRFFYDFGDTIFTGSALEISGYLATTIPYDELILLEYDCQRQYLSQIPVSEAQQWAKDQ